MGNDLEGLERVRRFIEGFIDSGSRSRASRSARCEKKYQRE
jgi:hypothetical protein